MKIDEMVPDKKVQNKNRNDCKYNQLTNKRHNLPVKLLNAFFQLISIRIKTKKNLFQIT